MQERECVSALLHLFPVTTFDLLFVFISCLIFLLLVFIIHTFIPPFRSVHHCNHPTFTEACRMIQDTPYAMCFRIQCMLQLLLAMLSSSFRFANLTNFQYFCKYKLTFIGSALCSLVELLFLVENPLVFMTRYAL